MSRFVLFAIVAQEMLRGAVFYCVRPSLSLMVGVRKRGRGGDGGHKQNVKFVDEQRVHVCDREPGGVLRRADESK